MTHAEGLKDQGSYKPCNLVAGEYPRIERIVTIAAGVDLTKGAVLGRVTASGKFALSASASSDGTELPDAILAEDVFASSNDVQAVVYFSGEFLIHIFSREWSNIWIALHHFCSIHFSDKFKPKNPKKFTSISTNLNHA